MWNVPELTEQYVERMEDVLEIYERPLDPAEPVVCLDEKPITLHAESGRSPQWNQAVKRAVTVNTNAVELPTSFAP